MKRLAIVAIVLPLAGCGPSFPTIDGSALAEAVAQVRGHTIQICNYFPSDSSLVAILTASSPVVETAYNIAKQICDAVTATVPPLSPAQEMSKRQGDENQCPMVRGVCITGRFIQEGKAP
jgi:hypothetical protein